MVFLWFVHSFVAHLYSLCERTSGLLGHTNYTTLYVSDVGDLSEFTGQMANADSKCWGCDVLCALHLLLDCRFQDKWIATCATNAKQRVWAKKSLLVRNALQFLCKVGFLHFDRSHVRVSSSLCSGAPLGSLDTGVGRSTAFPVWRPCHLLFLYKAQKGHFPQGLDAVIAPLLPSLISGIPPASSPPPQAGYLLLLSQGLGWKTAVFEGCFPPSKTEKFAVFGSTFLHLYGKRHSFRSWLSHSFLKFVAQWLARTLTRLKACWSVD